MMDRFESASKLLDTSPSDLISIKLRPENASGQAYLYHSDYEQFLPLLQQHWPSVNATETYIRGGRVWETNTGTTRCLFVQHETGPEFILAVSLATILATLVVQTTGHFINMLKQKRAAENVAFLKIEARRDARQDQTLYSIKLNGSLDELKELQKLLSSPTVINQSHYQNYGQVGAFGDFASSFEHPRKTEEGERPGDV